MRHLLPTLLLFAACGGETPQGAPQPPAAPGAPAAAKGPSVYVALDQQFSQPLLDRFAKELGVPVQQRHDSEAAKTVGLVSAILEEKGNPRCTVFWNNELAHTVRLAQEGLLEPYASPAAAAVPAQWKDAAGRWTAFAARARVIIVNTEVLPDQKTWPTSYQDLADPKWKGRICIRSGSHDYNLALFGQFFASYGPAKAREVISGIAANLARAPKGNDREQARAIYEGKCDVALMNTYYHAFMAANPEQKPWADAVGVFFPSQAGKGTFIMRSAAGVTKNAKNRDLAIGLLEYMASKEGQELVVDRTKQYSVRTDVPAHPLMVKLGAEQGLVDGRFKMDFVPLSQMAGKREEVIKLVNEIRFDAER